jgi:hypothetical protein
LRRGRRSRKAPRPPMGCDAGYYERRSVWGRGSVCRLKRMERAGTAGDDTAGSPFPDRVRRGILRASLATGLVLQPHLGS